MSFIRNLLALALALAMAGVGVLFALQNADPVPLDILIMSLPPRSIALWVLGALALGGILGLAFSSLAIFRLRTQHIPLNSHLNRIGAIAEKAE